MRIANFSRKLVFSFIFSLSLLLTPSFAGAESQTASPSAIPEKVDSYNLFWPLSAGKTESDSLYALKLFKETVEGWFVFGDSKKVDYAILLGTKRVLEAEKLLMEGKNELAIKALGIAADRYGEAYELAKKAHAKGKFSPQEIRRDRLVNVRRLVDHLKADASSEVAAKLEKVEEKVNLLLSDYLAKNVDRQLDI